MARPGIWAPCIWRWKCFSMPRSSRWCTCRTRAAVRRSTRCCRARCRWCPRSSRPPRARSTPGNVRILAQWGTERLPNFPHAPTLQEAGYPDVIYILWTGVFAPAKTPAHVTRILRDAIGPFMQDKAVIARFENAGSQVAYLDGPQFAQFLQADTDRLLTVVRKIGLS